MVALSTAVAGGSGAVLAVAGRTATCEVESVERLRCPDGTTLTADHQEAGDTAVVVYHPRGWVNAQTETTYRSADYGSCRSEGTSAASDEVDVFLAGHRIRAA
ncbi:hypothetical protein AB0C12_02620 [Actinoplanes sp. NPDC048967]|uniref:hypothetical protein n=1 Tax=Actinoplanes sp. NPDC048967 TaxID=3155269 RepID=UPI0033FD5C03